jgi:cytochrome c oxidase subunit IV
MSDHTAEDITPQEDSELAVEAALESRHTHPSDMTYVGIAFLLAAFTAIEVGIYYLHPSTWTALSLILFMILKFGVVVAYFMHLRFDSPVLRRLFIGGLTLAVVVYTIVLFMFGFYHF